MTLYDPLTWENLMAGVIAHFERQECTPLTDAVDAQGPGIYALFYTGLFDVYSPISGKSIPIYVGKAVPPGSRKGTAAINLEAPAIRNRLQLHARSIDSTDNLNLDDFKCRALAVVPVWITLAERFMIDHYEPIWNKGVDGFGNNPQGKARNTEVSWWDTLHPGRAWAAKLPRVKTEDQARERVTRYFSEIAE